MRCASHAARSTDRPVKSGTEISPASGAFLPQPAISITAASATKPGGRIVIAQWSSDATSKSSRERSVAGPGEAAPASTEKPRSLRARFSSSSKAALVLAGLWLCSCLKPAAGVDAKAGLDFGLPSRGRVYVSPDRCLALPDARRGSSDPACSFATDIGLQERRQAARVMAMGEASHQLSVPQRGLQAIWLALL